MPLAILIWLVSFFYHPNLYEPYCVICLCPVCSRIVIRTGAWTKVCTCMHGCICSSCITIFSLVNVVGNETSQSQSVRCIAVARRLLYQQYGLTADRWRRLKYQCVTDGPVWVANRPSMEHYYSLVSNRILRRPYDLLYCIAIRWFIMRILLLYIILQMFYLFLFSSNTSHSLLALF